ncbi:MAG: Ig-like domain-containing protein, partial [Anaerolineae bacterium]|nr:Ig-like domain-containing protein [Anaerolineae bacterium]
MEFNLVDAQEVTIYNPLLQDTDGNGTWDGDEDLDNDGLTNVQELIFPYALDNADTDGDGILDSNEDFDADGLTNIQELLINQAAGLEVYDPTVADTDGDTILDGDEDYDEDGLSNSEEIVLGTDPLIWDTDGDGLPDGYEVNVSLTDPLLTDSDENGVSDDLEDPDEDGLSNIDEYTHLTDPFNSDSDEDTLPDGFEVQLSLTDPNQVDTDHNGINDPDEDPDLDDLTNYQEFLLGTDPLSPTTLGTPSRLRSETMVQPASALADGETPITLTTIVRDSQGHFLPNRPVTWVTSNPNLVFSASSGMTDQAGVAQ